MGSAVSAVEVLGLGVELRAVRVGDGVFADVVCVGSVPAALSSESDPQARVRVRRRRRAAGMSRRGRIAFLMIRWREQLGLNSVLAA